MYVCVHVYKCVCVNVCVWCARVQVNVCVSCACVVCVPLCVHRLCRRPQVDVRTHPLLLSTSVIETGPLHETQNLPVIQFY